MTDKLIAKFNLNFKIDDSLLENLKNLNFRKTKNIYKIKKKKSQNMFSYIKEYTIDRRKITIYSEKKIKSYYINKIDKILNFFDSIFYMENKKKMYLIDIYLNDIPKVLSKDYPEACKENINSASNLLKKNHIVIYRKEEWSKILIHELIHYLNLHIYLFQKDLLYAFKDIKTNSIIKPNEAYTEFLSLIFYYFIFHEKEINRKLNCELAWGFIQTARVLKSKNIVKYQELFTKEYKQNTSLLSYYLLKTYFLFNERFQKAIILYYRDKNEDNYFQDINLKDRKFHKIIDYCLENLDENKTLKMSLVK